MYLVDQLECSSLFWDFAANLVVVDSYLLRHQCHHSFWNVHIIVIVFSNVFFIHYGWHCCLTIRIALDSYLLHELWNCFFIAFLLWLIYAFLLRLPFFQDFLQSLKFKKNFVFSNVNSTYITLAAACCSSILHCKK